MNNYLKSFISLLILSLAFLNSAYSQEYKIIKSDDTQLILEFDFTNKFKVNDIFIDNIKFTAIEDERVPFQNPGDPYLPLKIYEIGIPQNTNAVVSVTEIEREIYNDKFVISTPDSLNQPLNKLKYNQEIYGVNSNYPVEFAAIRSEAIFRYIKIATLYISPFQFNPVDRTLILNKRIIVRLEYKEDATFTELINPISDRMTEDLIKTNLVNPQEAINFVGKMQSASNTNLLLENYWYDPNKEYYKIYLKTEGVYRVTYDQLINSGISPSSGIQNGKLELFNNELKIPIDIADSNSDGLFNSGDYFQFIGRQAPPVDEYTYYNIYNNTNVYWFSYQADSGYYYKSKDGYPIQTYPKIQSNLNTIHFEKDLIYEKLGYAPDANRDYWFWDKAEARNGTATYIFRYDFLRLDDNMNQSLPSGKVRVNVHGMNTFSCSPGHSAYINLNGQRIGNFSFPAVNQSAYTFEKDFLFGFYSWSTDSIRILWEGNYFETGVDGQICTTAGEDIIRVNWFEFDYWRWNRVQGDYYKFKSAPGQYGRSLFYLWQWTSDNMKIYIPQNGVMISNPRIENDADRSVMFVDTIQTRTEYFLVSNSNFSEVDSIKGDISSNLRNISNAADYIIITHPDFRIAAERLAEFRSNNIANINSPRIMVVNVNDIYDEFSAGLMNPYALQKFVKYAFENWENSAPSYIVLMGDLSSDYRKIYGSSRTNYIPSIPYHSTTYGQAASDNNIATVVGTDLVPELAIGRISCETLEEAELLVDKIINYPADNGKQWKQNVLLLSSGLSAADENALKFNDRNMILANNYIDPNGIKSTKVFRYPNKPEYIQYQGEGPDIRREIDNGAVIVNYYGHGGGYQWDLVFTDDDILALNNGNRLPFVISVTCYTAHYDNQEVFGEIFNSIPGKGSIAFFGSSGVTFWPTTAYFNEDLFKEIIRNKRYAVGDAILKAKSNSGYGTMLALLTLLGDPALELALPYNADFVINSSSISIEPINPLINDTVNVKIRIDNLGRNFPGDSVNVELYHTLVSDSTLIGSRKLASFNQVDSTFFTWIPIEDGEIKLILNVNSDYMVDETDHSDNSANQIFSVFSIDRPKILKPVKNYFSNKNLMDFLIVDIGHFVGQSFTYQIIIDTSRSLQSQTKIISPVLSPSRGLVSWSSPQLSQGEYFYEVYIYSNADTNKSEMETFSISSVSGNGYLVKAKQLLDLNTANLNYSDATNSLILNTSTLPPRPSREKLLDSIYVPIPPDSTEITSVTTDGTYLYFGHLSFYRNGKKSKIYRVGTGFNGTTKGSYYGTVGNLEVEIKNQIFYHSDGFLYVATGDDSTLLRIDLTTSDTLRIDIPGKLLPSEDGLLRNNGIYITSDGNYVYNISPGHGEYRNKHVLRILDPASNWNKVGEDIVFLGSSEFGFSGFFVSDGYAMTYESYWSGYMRRYRISDGFFEEEFAAYYGSADIYCWTYDWTNNFVYGGLFRPNNFRYNFGFLKYIGTYVQAFGSLTTKDIGPARKWDDLNFNLDNTGSLGYFTNYLFGKNNITQTWDTLSTNIPPSFSLSGINAEQYQYLKMQFDLVDSTLGQSEPMKFKSLQVNYDYFPEINLYPDEIVFNIDTLMQGFPVEMSLKLIILVIRKRIV